MTNYYCTPDKVRKNIQVGVDEVPDADIYPYIEDAQKDFIRDISYGIKDDVLSPDSSGTTFTTKFPYIADVTYDNTINSLDVVVYGWGNSEDPGTKETLAVSTVYPRNGKIVLSTASTFSQVTADYRYYSTLVDYELLPEACAVLAAYYYANAEVLLMPTQWMHGAYRFTKTREVKDLISLYWTKVYAIRGLAHEVGEGKEATFNRSEP